MEFIHESPEQSSVQPSHFLQHFEDLDKRANGVQPIINESKADELLSRCKLNPLIEITEPPICISIESNGISAPFGTLGNFSVLLGKAKSKKTFIASMITAAALRNSLLQNVIRCKFPEGKTKIVLFDTEMSEYHVWKVVMIIFAISGGKKEELDKVLDVFCLRSLRPEERILAIDHYLKTVPGIGLVIIDGIRDLLHDINDSAQANQVAQYLMTWSKEHFVHIVTVIHTNKGDGNARGHIGSEVIFKSETVAEVIKDKIDTTISTVEARDCRGIEFETFAIALDSNGLPQIIDGFKENEPGKSSRSQYPSDIVAEVHREALAKVFKNNPQPGALDFAKGVKMAFQGLGISFGDNAARDFVKYYEQNGLVNVKRKQAGNRTLYSSKESSNESC